MNKVIPIIYSGSNRLLVSETIACDPKLGLLMQIPMAVGSDGKNPYYFNIKFVFLEDSSNTLNWDYQLHNNDFTITLTNATKNPLGVGTIEPCAFHIGDENFLLYLISKGLIGHTMLFTVSIYRKNKNG